MAFAPEHFGNPLREQALLAQGQAWAWLSRDVVEVSGADRLGYLTTVSSQVLTDLENDGQSRQVLFLDANGHILYAALAVSALVPAPVSGGLSGADDAARTADDAAGQASASSATPGASVPGEQSVLLLVDAGCGEGLAQLLNSRRFMLRVQAQVRPDLQVAGAIGDGVQKLADVVKNLVTTWHDPWPGITPGGSTYFTGTRHPGANYRAGGVVVALEAGQAAPGQEQASGQEAAQLALAPGQAAASGSAAAPGQEAAPGQTTGLTQVGELAWEALRIEAGLPRWAREVDARAIPNELDWLRTGVHLNKGCYPGQETIARTVNLGRPPRRLVQLQLAGWQGQLPEVGARVYLPAGDNPAGKAVGTITSVARHWELGNIALALVRRGVPAQAELAVDLEAGYESASQELLVDPAGKAEASPSQRPGLGLKRLRPEHG
ncbi:CAF17-like 4Fe-4S cluster assembly/insertion protein YgfZ [Actinomyces graevenitzii]|uniref:CAF17-like 4Fe-4S cluster assembly/insertion protein YgfZ n=1 Tax=Actinomyces graevenitzii TaxID=55565 RepID=UPI001FD3511D|nr:folate-binding protein [Actinomyces graevenitzii]